MYFIVFNALYVFLYVRCWRLVTFNIFHSSLLNSSFWVFASRIVLKIWNKQYCAKAIHSSIRNTLWCNIVFFTYAGVLSIVFYWIILSCVLFFMLIHVYVNLCKMKTDWHEICASVTRKRLQISAKYNEIMTLISIYNKMPFLQAEFQCVSSSEIIQGKWDCFYETFNDTCIFYVFSYDLN